MRDWHLAEDMVQGTFVRLYAHWHRVRRESVDAYARRILVNLCLSHVRRPRRETSTAELPESGVVDPAPDTGAAAMLDLLPPRQRAIIALRFLDDLSVGEVARALNITEGTVKSQSARALTTLRRLMPQLLIAEERF